MQTKTAKPKNARPAAGQQRSATATKKSRVASETGLTQAATLTTGLLAENGDLTPSEIALNEAVTAQDATASADPTGTTTEDTASLAVVPAGQNREAEASEPIPTEAEPVADRPAPPVEEVVSDSATLPRTGLVESPLAQRMRAEAARGGRKTRASHRDLGPEFEAANNRAKALQAQFEEAKAKIQGSEQIEGNAAKIREVRAEIRASRGAKVEGVETFNDAILEAREALKRAKQAKADFLTESGVGAAVAEDGKPSLRQRLKTLRAEKEALLEAGGGEGLTKIRAELKMAKAERKAACETAHAARQGEAQTATVEPDSQPRTDALANAQGGS